MIARAEGAADDTDQLAREEGCPVARGRLARESDEKFGPGDAGHDRAGRGVCRHSLDPPRNPAEQGVADHLTIGGVHAVELADGEQEDGRRKAGTLFQPLQRRLPRTKAGQVVPAGRVVPMRVGQPLDIGSHDAIDQAEMMNEPVARSPRRRMSKGFWPTRSHHAAQARNDRTPFCAR